MEKCSPCVNRPEIWQPPCDKNCLVLTIDDVCKAVENGVFLKQNLSGQTSTFYLPSISEFRKKFCLKDGDNITFSVITDDAHNLIILQSNGVAGQGVPVNPIVFPPNSSPSNIICGTVSLTFLDLCCSNPKVVFCGSPSLGAIEITDCVSF